MEGNPLLNPVGSLPPQVYWRRRAMAGILVVLVVWFAYTAFPGKGGGANAAQPKKAGTTTSAGPSPSPTAVVAAATSAAAVAPAVVPPPATVTSPAAKTTAGTTTPPPAATTPKCATTAIKITLTADHALYAAGVDPHFVLTVVNVGTAACRIDVGTANRGFLVTSGSDRIWSSSDCTKTTPNVALFKAGESVSYSHNWTRQRSTTAGCAAAGTPARAGTYRVTAHLGDLVSAPAVFRLG